jgi:hypothetical protein
MDVRKIWEDCLPHLKVQRIKWDTDGTETFGILPFHITEVDGMVLTFDTKTGRLTSIYNTRSLHDSAQ